MTENFIKNVVVAMQDSLTDEQLQKTQRPRQMQQNPMRKQIQPIN